MLPSRIIVSDVLAYFFLCNPLVLVRCHFQLRFDRSKTRFHERVVIAIVGATHALFHARSTKHLAVLFAGVLSAAIGVVDETRLWATRETMAARNADKTRDSCI